jgi:hypothetical protein
MTGICGWRSALGQARLSRAPVRGNLPPRPRMWREIRAKFSDAPPGPPSAGPPTPEERDPGCPRAEPERKSVAQLVEDEWANPREPAG